MSRTVDNIDSIVKDVVFGSDEQVKAGAQQDIRQIATEQGIFPASIQGLYDASGKGAYSKKTVPAVNIRGITYDVARAIFRSAMKNKVGAFIFEIARTEISYTGQRPAEYAACILAAAIKEGYKGPVFIQGDHFQVNAEKYNQDPDKEINAIKDLTREAVEAGFYNIDIDASTLVELDKPTIKEQQEKNSKVTAEMTEFIRSIEPQGVTISIGGEIGEVGKTNSTVEDLQAYMSGYIDLLDAGVKGISKISVQTGTSHGGVVLPDGSIAQVSIDFDTLEKLSKVSCEEYGMGGAVQHGASTLPDDAFNKFPEIGTVEVHLATGFQNMIYESAYFPEELLKNINRLLAEKYSAERKEGETDEQFLYKTRKKAFGDFKSEMWNLPAENLSGIGSELEDRFTLIFKKLNMLDTVDLVQKYVANTSIKAG